MGWVFGPAGTLEIINAEMVSERNPPPTLFSVGCAPPSFYCRGGSMLLSICADVYYINKSTHHHSSAMGKNKSEAPWDMPKLIAGSVKMAVEYVFILCFFVSLVNSWTLTKRFCKCMPFMRSTPSLSLSPPPTPPLSLILLASDLC